MTSEIRLLIVDRHAMFAQGLARLLEDEADVLPVGFANTMEEAVALARHSPPDLMLLDPEMCRDPSSIGVEALRALIPRARFLILAATESPEVLEQARALGAIGVASKRADIGALMEIIRRAMDGSPSSPPTSVAGQVKTVHGRRADRLRQDIPSGGRSRLTPREIEVLAALAAGRGTAEIAASLHISPLTVRSHVKSLLLKLGVHSKLEAVTLAIRSGLVKVDRPA